MYRLKLPNFPASQQVNILFVQHVDGKNDELLTMFNLYFMISETQEISDILIFLEKKILMAFCFSSILERYTSDIRMYHKNMTS